jgi:hypothetical protein
MALHLEILEKNKEQVFSEVEDLASAFAGQETDDYIVISFLGIELTFDFMNDEFFIEKN